MRFKELVENTFANRHGGGIKDSVAITELEKFDRLTKDPDTSDGIKYELDDLIKGSPKASKVVDGKTYKLYYLTMKASEVKGDKYWYLTKDGQGEKAFFDEYQFKVDAKAFLAYILGK